MTVVVTYTLSPTSTGGKSVKKIRQDCQNRPKAKDGPKPGDRMLAGIEQAARQRKQDKEEPFMLGRLRSATMAAEMVDEMCRAATPA